MHLTYKTNIIKNILKRRQPKITHFYTFESHTWACSSSYKRKALEHQRTTCNFLCYLEYVKGYILLDLSTIKLFVEKSVYIEEIPPHASLEQHVEDFVIPTMHDLRDDDSYHLDKSSNLISKADSKYHEPTCKDIASRPKWAQSTI